MPDIAPPVDPQTLTTLQRADLGWFARARLERVKDGDTFVFLVDTMFYGRHEPSIRLVGYSAAEADELGGADATARAAIWLAGHVHGSVWPYLIFTQRDKQSFARFLASAWCIADGERMQDMLVATL